MLSAAKFVAIIAEKGLLPPEVIAAFRQHVREMEQCNRHASARDIAHWLTKHEHLSTDVVEQIFRREEDWAPDPPNHDVRHKKAAGDPGSAEVVPPANNANVPQLDFGDALPLYHSRHQDRDRPIVPVMLGFAAACGVILLTYFTTSSRSNLAASARASKNMDSPDRARMATAGEAKSGKNSATIDWDKYSPSSVKQGGESSAEKPPMDKPVAEPGERLDSKQRVESHAEKPLADKPTAEPGERLQEAVAQALLPDECESVARKALEEASQAMAQGNRALVDKTLQLALASARKSDNTQLVKTVALCVLDARKGAESLQARLAETASPARKATEAANAKFPVPTRAERTASRRNILQVYGAKIAAAKDPLQKQALAKEFLQTAKATQKDWVARFVLLDLAREEAVGGIDCPTALLAVVEMDLSFQIRSIEIKAQTLKTFALLGTATEHHKQLSEKASELVEIALAQDSFAIAGELAKLAVQEAEKTWCNQLLEASIVRQREVEEMRAACQKANEFATRLETTPDDPDCNLCVGRYQCFLRGDWDRGLPCLALGDDKQLQALAEQELRGVASPDEEVALGDRWWNLAARGEKGPSQATQARACYWYQKALAGLDGFAKDRVQQRLVGHAPRSSAEAPQSPDPLLLGNWQVIMGSYKGRWTFSPNGIVVATGPSKRKATSGVWTIESGIVLVRWTPETWSTLHCPLKSKDTSGESWQGEKRESLIANKYLK